MIEDVRAALLGDHEAAKRLAEAERYAARLETIGADKVRDILCRFTLSVSYLVTQKEETHG